MWVCSDVPLYLKNYSIKLIYIHIAHPQYELNEGIKRMCFACRFNVIFSRNQRKCSQNGKDGNLIFVLPLAAHRVARLNFLNNARNIKSIARTLSLYLYKFMKQMIHHLVGHEILNKTVYFACHFSIHFSRKWWKCSQNLNSEKRNFQNANSWGKWYIML